MTSAESTDGTLIQKSGDIGRRLPRGPHNLSRDVVAASQRERLLEALTHLLAEGGERAVTIGALAKRAGVSRATFYEQFEDREACMLAAYDNFTRELLDRILGEIDVGPQSWEAFIEKAVGSYLQALEDDPLSARAFLVELESAGDSVRERRRRAIDGFAAVFNARHKEARELNPELGELPARSFLLLVLGVREMARLKLEEEREPKLSELTDDLVATVRATVQGAGGD